MRRQLFVTILLSCVLLSIAAQADEVSGEKGAAVKPRNDLAFTIGIPGVFNLSYTRALTKPVGTRLTGGGVFIDKGHWFGIQGELVFILEHTETFTGDLSFGLGVVSANNDEDDGTISYAALFANIRYRRLFVQFGTGPTISNSGTFGDDAVTPFQIGIILARF